MDEECILTDLRGECIGRATKKECHLNTNISKGMLHRAFSVISFKRENDGSVKMLMQRRSTSKITFPQYLSNTCCSHPLASIAEETELEEARGVKIAAVRKLKHELGVTNVALEDFVWCALIRHTCQSDDVWGEHEIDYILLLEKDLNITINENEVMSYVYCTQEEFQAMMQAAAADGPIKITPWLRHLHNSGMLGRWWQAVEDRSFKTDAQKWAGVRNVLVDFVCNPTF